MLKESHTFLRAQVLKKGVGGYCEINKMGKNETFLFAGKLMKLVDALLSEINQTQKEKYGYFSFR